MPSSQEPSGATARQLSALATARPEHAAALALRTRSLVARGALAHAVSDGRLTDSELLQLAVQRQLPEAFLTRRPARRLAALALTWACQVRTGVELEAAALTYLALWGTDAGPNLPARHHQVAAQTLLLTGRAEELRRVLRLLSRLPRGMQPFLDADLANPYAPWAEALGSAVAGERHEAWEELLSAPFRAQDLSSLRVRAGTRIPASHLFDRLSAPGTIPRSVDGPPVTVIMPCYRPDESLLTSVASMSAQTYGPLRILLVDDASGPQSEPWFEQAVALDDRVTLIRREVNGGSYLARNEALRHATGEFMTFQDADDWSHPQRLAAQVQVLTDEPTVPACHTLAVRAHDDLTHQWLGYRPVRTNASSLMVRSAVVAQLGDFLEVRKGADSEYAERIAAEVGPVGNTQTPLTISRLRGGSLSRSDFTYQWTSPDRLTFRGTYRAWLRAGRSTDFPAPLSFVQGLGHEGVSAALVTAYLADFSADPQEDPGRVAPVWDAPDGATAGRTGLWHLERPWDAVATRSEMHERWFDRVVSTPTLQAISRVEPVHVQRLVVLDPSVLLLAGDQECRVSADRVEVQLLPGDENPGTPGEPLDLLVVAEVVRRWFGLEPQWVRSG